MRKRGVLENVLDFQQIKEEFERQFVEKGKASCQSVIDSLNLINPATGKKVSRQRLQAFLNDYPTGRKLMERVRDAHWMTRYKNDKKKENLTIIVKEDAEFFSGYSGTLVPLKELTPDGVEGKRLMTSGSVPFRIAVRARQVIMPGEEGELLTFKRPILFTKETVSSG